MLAGHVDLPRHVPDDRATDVGYRDEFAVVRVMQPRYLTAVVVPPAAVLVGEHQFADPGAKGVFVEGAEGFDGEVDETRKVGGQERSDVHGSAFQSEGWRTCRPRIHARPASLARPSSHPT